MDSKYKDQIYISSRIPEILIKISDQIYIIKVIWNT